MRSLLLALSLAPFLLAPPSAQAAPSASRSTLQEPGSTPPDSPPDPARVQAAVEHLKEAFKTRNDAIIAESIAQHGAVASPEVVAILAGGLESAKIGVRRSSVEGLRTNPSDDARLALERCWKKGERIKTDVDLQERVLKAIASHESPESIELFAKLPEPTEEVPEPEAKEIVTARLRGLGRIRDERAVIALMDLLTRLPEDRARALLPDIRLSLFVLTNVDHGDNLKAWQRWWETARAELEVAAEPQLLPTVERTEWFTYWGFPLESEYDPEAHPRGRR